MANALDPAPPGFLLGDVDIEEFRELAHQHAGAELTSEDARSVSTQLLRILAVVRDVRLCSASTSASPVDKRPLPESGVRAITTSSPA